MPISPVRLNHAVLYVRDLDRSVDFYQRVFGFDAPAVHDPCAVAAVPSMA